MFILIDKNWWSNKKLGTIVSLKIGVALVPKTLLIWASAGSYNALLVAKAGALK